METIKRDKAGYTILVQDKYILCGTCRDSYFKEIDKLGVSNPRQYKSLKVLIANVGNHLDNWRNPFNFDEIVIKAGYYSTGYYWDDNKRRANYSREAIKYLIKEGYIKIVKISQILSLEEIKDID